MFTKILVANRGEIACRIIRTAHAMGVQVVAVYSDVDAGALHVEMADEAIPLGGKTAAESYLQADKIIAAAKASGAEAVHPGYGFLSENPDFVEALEAAGLTFIGPSAKAIRAMGLKDAAKKIMEEAGVPVVPGYHGADQSPEKLAQAAEEIGYPVLIKAVAGGGGKGMRLVEDAAEFESALTSAKSEAQAAFGNPNVLIEKFVEKPRHIEIQVFGDRTGAVHLFERDCSLQRRHQKVIEEAPAPDMPEQVREAMGASAVRAAEAIGYKGAGTVEFIVDGSDGLKADGYFFMEMNTRLQVEHPVTECITGVDLVEWQLRVAAGETLDDLPTNLEIKGHAFEARIYAEDPVNDFLPVTGKLTHLSFPKTARCDSGVRDGDEISPYYDPMIAKLIVHGPTRAVALRQMRAALRETQIAGMTTNLSFLGALCDNSAFAAGDVDTGLIARNAESLLVTPAVNPIEVIAAGMAATGLVNSSELDGFSLWTPGDHSVQLLAGEDEFSLAVSVHGPKMRRWTYQNQTYDVQADEAGWRLGHEALPQAHLLAGEVTIFGAVSRVFRIIDPMEKRVEDAADQTQLKAPMPGLVKVLNARPGQAVNAGDALVVLEAMKMEHTLLAAKEAVLSAVHIAEGDQVTAGAILVEFEEADQE